ncbi:MAG: hypothetical protein H7Y09_15340 [Chitinophagaceae bacterium]|nr:hypothetical protein [Anaerolineae bacterium]
MRKKVLLINLIIGLFVLAAAVFAPALSEVIAQDTYTSQDAIQVAAAHEAFADGLATHPGWTAAAYNTGNVYGIWHVQFWDENGEDMGWADVSPARERVYLYETHYGATTEQTSAAEAPIREFLSRNDEIQDLLGEITEDDYLYVEYDGYNRWWGVYIDRSIDSIYAVVQFEGKSPSALDDASLLFIGFNEVLSYEEWQTASQAEAIALAFAQPEIAAATRLHPDWTATAELVDPETGAIWIVNFATGDQPLAQATVDLPNETIIAYTVN